MIKSISMSACGEFLIAIEKSDSEIPHLIGLHPGDDVPVILSANSAAIERMGHAPMPQEDIAYINEQVGAAWTSEVVASYQSAHRPPA